MGKWKLGIENFWGALRAVRPCQETSPQSAEKQNCRSAGDRRGGGWGGGRAGVLDGGDCVHGRDFDDLCDRWFNGVFCRDKALHAGVFCRTLAPVQSAVVSGIALAKLALAFCVGLGWWDNEHGTLTIGPPRRALNGKVCTVAREAYAAMAAMCVGITKPLGGVTVANGGITESHGGILKPRGGITEMEGGITQLCVGITCPHVGITPRAPA